jgi:single-stranded DNA-binding protein
LFFRMGIREYSKDKNRKSTFIDVGLFGKRVEKLGPYLLKGKYILVRGKLQITDTQKDGKWYKNVRIWADDIEFLEKRTAESFVGATDVWDNEKDAEYDKVQPDVTPENMGGL